MKKFPMERYCGDKGEREMKGIFTVGMKSIILLGPGSSLFKTSIVLQMAAFLHILGAGLADDWSVCVKLNPVTMYLAPCPSPLLYHPSLCICWIYCTCPSTSGTHCTSGLAAQCTSFSDSHTFCMVGGVQSPCHYPPRVADSPKGTVHSVSVAQSAVNLLIFCHMDITTSMLHVDLCTGGDEAGVTLITWNSSHFMGCMLGLHCHQTGMQPCS